MVQNLSPYTLLKLTTCSLDRNTKFNRNPFSGFGDIIIALKKRRKVR